MIVPLLYAAGWILLIIIGVAIVITLFSRIGTATGEAAETLAPKMERVGRIIGMPFIQFSRLADAIDARAKQQLPGWAAGIVAGLINGTMAVALLGGSVGVAVLLWITLSAR